MKTGIALLPEVDRSQAITFSLVDYLLSNKYLTKKQISDIVNELETVVLTASLLHDVVWEEIHKKTNKIITQQKREKNSRNKRTNQKNERDALVDSICNEDPEQYQKYIIKTAVDKITKILEGKYPEVKIATTAIRDRFIEWKKAREISFPISRVKRKSL